MYNKNSNIDCIFFDCFGVILDEVSPQWLAAHFPPERAAELNRTVIRNGDLGNFTETEIFKKLSELSGEPAEEIRQEWAFAPRQRANVIKMISELRKSYKTVLLSNALPHIVENNLGDKLNTMFDEVIISYKIGMAKPDADIFQYAIEKAGIPADRCVFTDDNPNNIVAAEKEGIHGIVFTDAEAFLTRLENL